MKRVGSKIICVLLAICVAFALFGCSKKVEEPTTTTTETTTEAPKYINPFTGKEGYNKSAVGVRPVAIVVENAPDARPQWAIDKPDIIVEGEVEGGISRMLWLFADMTAVPEKVGPIRSARPSFVKFSELFDSIYIHWGGSHSKGDYVGGYETISNDGVDDIDGMGGGSLFGRDSTRNVSSEHRGILDGTELVSTIKDKGYRTKLDDSKFSTLAFNEKLQDAGTDKASTVSVRFSSRTDKRDFSYDTEKGKYVTGDWREDVSFQNIIVLMDETTYITTAYSGYASSVTYLNYSLKSGSGYYASNGTIKKINWSITDGKLALTDEAGNELKLNQGNSYIGLASSNNEGSVVYSTPEE